MGDCAINLKPSPDELVEIAAETANTASFFGIEPKVALLSYSTLGSGKGEDVDRVHEAAEKLKSMPYPSAKSFVRGLFSRLAAAGSTKRQPSSTPSTTSSARRQNSRSESR